MKAKDTVMDYSDMVNHPIISKTHTELDKGYDEREVAKAQAERTEAMLKDQWKQVGIRGMVEGAGLTEEQIQAFCDVYYIHYYTPYIKDILKEYKQAILKAIDEKI